MSRPPPKLRQVERAEARDTAEPADATSELAQQIVDGWNTGDLDLMTGRFADGVRLTAIAPKTQPDRQPAEIHGKEVLRQRLQQMPVRPTFQLLGALKAANLLSLALRDQDGDVLTVTIEIDETGAIRKIVSFRPS